jgi:hypothetical protein
MSSRARSIGLAAAAVAVMASFAVLQTAAFPPLASLAATLGGKLAHLALFAVFWLAVYGVGRGIAYALFRKQAPPPEVSLALGVVAFVYLAFGMCAARLAYGAVVKVFVVAAAAAGLFFGRREWARLPARLGRWVAELEVSTAALVVGGAVVVLPLALSAAHPPTFVDALVYHLAVPQAYAQAHGFTYLPYNLYASMPLGGSLFYVGPLLWDGLICANASHLVVTVAAVAVTYRLARRWLGQFFAALAALLLLLTPIVFKVVGGAQNDHFLLLFVVTFLYFYFGAAEVEGPARRRRYLASGLFLGAALAVKYVAAWALVAFLPVLTYDLIRRRTRPAEAALLLGVAVAFLGPWLLKAYVERGNPVFPLLYDVFGGRDFSADQARRLTAWQYDMGFGRGWRDYLLLPYRISVKADVFYGGFAGRYLPFVLPLAALAVAFFRRGGRLVAFAWVYLVAWAVGPQQLRFLDGAVPAFAIAAAGTLAAADEGWNAAARRLWRVLVAALVFAVALPLLIAPIFSSLPRQVYLVGMPREDFLRRWVAFYGAQEFLNRDLPDDSTVLLVHYNGTLYLERAAVYDSILEASAFLAAAEEAEEEAELYDWVRERDVTHVHLYLPGEDLVRDSYDEATLERVRNFLARFGAVVYEDGYNRVYELI